MHRRSDVAHCGALQSVLLPFCYLDDMDRVTADDVDAVIASIAPKGLRAQGVDEDVLGILVSFGGADVDEFVLCLSNVTVRDADDLIVDVDSVEVVSFAFLSVGVDTEHVRCESSDGLPCLS